MRVCVCVCARDRIHDACVHAFLGFGICTRRAHWLGVVNAVCVLCACVIYVMLSILIELLIEFTAE